ncbi:MAG: hypothetical protein JNM52_08575 [Betaproteobacteria bacterium]|nr:hypothetical protein [Betaproteobacteria bacterium]
MAAALEGGLKHEGLPLNTVRRTVSLSPEMIETLKAQGATLQPPLSVGKLVGCLLHAYALQSRPKVKRPPSWPDADTRPEQRRVLDAVVPHLLQGRIVLSEAGTGIGKTRIALYAADAILKAHQAGTLVGVELEGEDQVGKLSKHAKTGQARGLVVQAARMEKELGIRDAVVICAPTIANVAHIASELVAVRSLNKALQASSIGILLGRSQFVSITRINLLLTEMLMEAASATEEQAKLIRQSCTQARAWLDDGMPSGKSEQTRVLATVMPSLVGLLDDLRAVAPDLPIEDAALTEDDEVEDQAYYLAACLEARQAALLITTHAMLAADNRALIQGTPPLLPNTIGLVIDEAHLFEKAQSNACSIGCSFLTLRSMLRTLPKADIALDACQSVIVALRRIPGEMDLPKWRGNDRISSAAWVAALPVIVKLKDALQGLLVHHGKKKQDTHQKALRFVREAKSTLEPFCAESSSYGALTFSSIKRYPTLTSGPINVANYLSARWAVSYSALLLSGTLLVPTSEGSSDLMIRSYLALPPDRTVLTPPVHPPWLLSTPTVYLPNPMSFHELVPPSGEVVQTETLVAWIAAVATQLVRIHQTAVGGTLVLMTGYERAGLLAEKLAKRGLANHLIEQSRLELPLLSAKTLFIEHSMAGKKPIWIGVGGAWTGIDLMDNRYSDDESQQDKLLTDLVVPALPFGMDRTMTHRQRVTNSGFKVEKQSALMLFRQGVGRLVRRKGVQNRRLWILDGRLEHPAYRSLTAEFIAMLMAFEKRQVIPI